MKYLYNYTFDTLYKDSVDYELDFLKKKHFFKKTNKGSNINIKLKSSRRNININLLNKILNTTMYKGNKLTLLKHYNIFIEKFMPLFIEKIETYNSYMYYDFTCNLVDFEPEYYEFEYMLAPSIPLFEQIFDIQTKKVDKKLKKLHPYKDYIIDVVYLSPKKREKRVLKMFNLYTQSYKYYYYSDRLFSTFASIILDPANSSVWKRRLYSYKFALQKLHKRTQ